MAGFLEIHLAQVIRCEEAAQAVWRKLADDGRRRRQKREAIAAGDGHAIES